MLHRHSRWRRSLLRGKSARIAVSSHGDSSCRTGVCRCVPCRGNCARYSLVEDAFAEGAVAAQEIARMTLKRARGDRSKHNNSQLHVICAGGFGGGGWAHVKNDLSLRRSTFASLSLSRLNSLNERGRAPLHRCHGREPPANPRSRLPQALHPTHRHTLSPRVKLDVSQTAKKVIERECSHTICNDSTCASLCRTRSS